MACNCGGGNQDNAVFVVTLRDGTQKEVTGERTARIEITKSGGGTYRKK